MFVNRLNLNECTLHKRLMEGTSSTKLGRFTRTFTDIQEAEIAEHCRECDAMFYGLSLRTFRKIINEYSGVTTREYKGTLYPPIFPIFFFYF